MKKTILILATMIYLSSCSCTSNNDFEKGKKRLEGQGYTDVKNTGHNFFCCDNKESFSTGFEATDKNGNIVKGCFCSNFLKGITVRYE